MSLPRRILLVEDHWDSAEATAKLLRQMGHIVLLAPTLAAARGLIETQPFELILCDLNLPDGNGRELVPLARLHCPQARLVALTGDSHSGDGDGLADVGFDAHLVKPILPNSLLDHL
jgi:CheY-like chemotaxis protein